MLVLWRLNRESALPSDTLSQPGKSRLSFDGTRQVFDIYHPVSIKGFVREHESKHKYKTDSYS